MDRAYEGDDTRQLALDLGYVPVVPPKSNRLDPWEYDKAMYRKRNEVERLFPDSRAFAVSSHALTNSMPCSLASSISP